jgi:SAM-dependent methyltransferase
MPGDLLFPTRRVDGGTLSATERAAPRFAGIVELPREHVVREHTGRVARFSGWMACTEDTPGRVRIRVGDAEPVEFTVDGERPEVAWVMAAGHGMPYAWGFECFVEVPPTDEPVPAQVELTDGSSIAPAGTYQLMPDFQILSIDTYVGDPPVLHELALRHLRGKGLEFGALHSPVPDGPDYEIIYADRMSRADSIALYDELAPFAPMMVEVDHIVDLDRDDLGVLAEHDFDFFVAAGVIEHLVNPLRFLENLHRVMKPGARFLLSAPDRDFTWDCRRELTSNEHLYDEYERNVEDLSDEHVVEYLWHVSPIRLPAEEPGRSELIEFHRERSIHVHVWDEASFDDFLRFANERLGLTFEVVERASSRRGIGNVVYVLRKAG